MAGLRVDPTPNPNSIKITLDRPVLPQGSFSASSADQASGNELARKLFAIGRVTNIFLLNNFISVNKDPGTEWSDLSPRIEQVVREHFGM